MSKHFRLPFSCFMSSCAAFLRKKSWHKNQEFLSKAWTSRFLDIFLFYTLAWSVRHSYFSWCTVGNLESTIQGIILITHSDTTTKQPKSLQSKWGEEWSLLQAQPLKLWWQYCKQDSTMMNLRLMVVTQLWTLCYVVDNVYYMVMCVFSLSDYLKYLVRIKKILHRRSFKSESWTTDMRTHWYSRSCVLVDFSVVCVIKSDLKQKLIEVWMYAKLKIGRPRDSNVQQHDDASQTLQWHLIQLQPPRRHVLCKSVAGCNLEDTVFRINYTNVQQFAVSPPTASALEMSTCWSVAGCCHVYGSFVLPPWCAVFSRQATFNSLLMRMTCWHFNQKQPLYFSYVFIVTGWKCPSSSLHGYVGLIKPMYDHNTSPLSSCQYKMIPNNIFWYVFSSCLICPVSHIWHFRDMC